jgi:hypothetical protein
LTPPHRSERRQTPDSPAAETGHLKIDGKENGMAKCDVCGNDYDKSFEVRKGGKTSTFDSFECAIHALAPSCGHCGCRIVGHGMEANGEFYCCAHCARDGGLQQMRDRAETRVT